MRNRDLWPLLIGTLLWSCAVDDVDTTPETSSEEQAALSFAHDPVITRTHSIRVGTHGRVVARESFTIKSLLRWPHRAIVLLNGTPTTGDLYNIPIDGYRGRELLARRGFFAFTLDFEGSGESTFPEDGFSLTFDAHTAAMREVVDYIRSHRAVPRVDVLGEAEGGGVAAQLCADDARIRSCTLSSMLYKTPTDAFNAFFQSPGFRAMVFGAPQGYLDIPPELYFNVLIAAPPDVAAWALATQPGPYSIGLIAEELAGLPAFDPTGARVPGLIIRGELDQNAPASDTFELAQDYGAAGGAAPATIISIPGAMMQPRLEAAPHNEQFWDAVLAFIDP
jgi:pimeloyl-ACP methyl ester carboxylesterase